MDDLLRTGRLPGELRSTTKIKNIIPEQTHYYTTPARAEVERTYYGPCLVCGLDTQYRLTTRSSQPRNAVEDWLLKQFAEERRKVHLSQLEGRRETGFLGTRSIEEIVCEPCRTKCAETRKHNLSEKWRQAEERASKRQQKERAATERARKERERWEHHITWRDATKEEFRHIPDRAARFLAVFGKRSFKLLFRWRPVGGRCRGDCPRNVVGLWVNGQFVTRYHGWSISPLPGERPYFDKDARYDDDACHDIWPPPDDAYTEDLYSFGFCRWIERTFQRELVRVKPAATWKAKFGLYPIDVESVPQLATPCVVHTEWIDRTVYARLLPAKDLSLVIAFAAEKLRLHIQAVTTGQA